MDNSLARKRKGKKIRKIIIWMLVLLVVVAGIAWSVVTFGGAKGSYDEEKVMKRDVVTYYSFSGVVEAKNSDSILADRALQVKEVLVKEGDKVKKDDELIKTTYGSNIKATMDGTVSKLYVETDSQVMSGMNLVDLVDYDHLQVSVKVDEYDLSSIAVHKKVKVTINALDKVVSGEISSISREAINTNGLAYFSATIDLAYNKVLRVGMSTEIRILNKRVKQVMTLSMKAIQFDANNKPFVLVKDAKGTAITQYIVTGMNDGNIVQVVKGLKVGQVVLVAKKVAVQSFGGAGMRPASASTQPANQSGGQSK
ncbi:MAG: HlyD family efflux transporter periplasmic adaptor subunit [Clostridia bacterium]